MRTRDLVAIAAIVAAVATAAVGLDPTVRFAFESSELRTALSVAQGLIAIVVAYLIYGRVKRRRLVNDFALVFALALLGVTNVFFAAIPAKQVQDAPLVFRAWAPLATHAIATLAIAWAALTPERMMTPSIKRPGLFIVVAVDVVLFVVSVVAALLRNVLPDAVYVTSITTGAPDLGSHVSYTVLLLSLGVLHAIATIGFMRRSQRRRDPLQAALAVGSVLFAFSFLCFAIYPSSATEIVQSGDALRLGFYLILLLGAEREIDRYWSRLADAAIYDERRRLARDLHDGVAQELAYVVTQTRLLVRGRAAPGTDERIAAAAERALDESRRAIIALTLRDDEPLHLAVARAAEDVAGRVGVEVDTSIPETWGEGRVTGDVREALVRIVQESVSNAGRHGNAHRVHIDAEDGMLRIVDDGTGFDPATAGDGRFGLVSMRERAQRHGLRLKIDSAPGRGTRVEVALR